MSDFWSDSLSTSILCVRTAKAVARLRIRAGLPEPSLVAYVISTISHELAQLRVLHCLSEPKLKLLCCTEPIIIEPPHDKTNKMACVLSKDSDSPRHPPSLIRIFAVHMKKLPIKRTAKTLIRLGRCLGWSESLLCAHIVLLVLSCSGSIIFRGPIVLIGLKYCWKCKTAIHLYIQKWPSG